jgi:hypothetical protein
MSSITLYLPHSRCTGFPSILSFKKYVLIPGMEGQFHTCQSMTYHINRIKDKDPVIISTDAEKSLDKIQHLFMVKA